MGFLRRLVGGGGPDAPEWAGFFSGGEYRDFVGIVEADLRRRGLDYSLGDGLVAIDRGHDEPDQFGLANLAQKCNAQPRNDWAGIVATHFSAVLGMAGRDLDALAEDFDQASPILRLRLYPDESMGGLSVDPKGPVLRPLAPGILLGLVFDFPDSVASVNEAHLAEWPRSEEEVLAIARENTLAEPLPIRDTIEGNDGAVVQIVAGDSFFVASRVLGLESLLPTEATHGAVVAVPNRHVLLWHPIVDLSVVGGLTAMGPIVQQMFQDGPGSISNQLYWWSAGDLIHLPIAPNKKGFDFAPPDRFVELLNGLQPPGGRS